MGHISVRGMIATLFGVRAWSSSSVIAPPASAHTQALQRSRLQQITSFSTSSPGLARKNKGPGVDRRITLIRYHLHHPTTLTPRPLRFSRNRYLRHWTIHRARQLHYANIKKQRQLSLERQYNAMAAANEELRVGAGDGGKLFRRAQMKTGTWSIPERGGGIPIEYARPMAEWVGTVGGGAKDMGRAGEGPAPAKIWDHDWKRL